MNGKLLFTRQCPLRLAGLVSIFLVFLLSCGGADNTMTPYFDNQGGGSSTSGDGTSGTDTKPPLYAGWTIYAVAYRGARNDSPVKTYNSPDAGGTIVFTTNFSIDITVKSLSYALKIDGKYEIQDNLVKLTANDGKITYGQFKIDGNNLEMIYGALNEYTFFASKR